MIFSIISYLFGLSPESIFGFSLEENIGHYIGFNTLKFCLKGYLFWSGD